MIFKYWDRRELSVFRSSKILHYCKHFKSSICSKFELVNIVFFLVSIMTEDSSLDSSFPVVHKGNCDLVSNVEDAEKEQSVTSSSSSSNLLIGLRLVVVGFPPIVLGSGVLDPLLYLCRYGLLFLLFLLRWIQSKLSKNSLIHLLPSLVQKNSGLPVGL